jgi:hypothetical protein
MRLLRLTKMCVPQTAQASLQHPVRVSRPHHDSFAILTVTAPSASNATSTLQLSAPSITGKARLARQAVATPSGTGYDPNYSFCEPYTLKQGPSTWEFHLTDPTPGAWTIDMDCKGMIASGDLVCTETQSGYVVGSAGLGVRTTSLGNAEILSLGALQTVAVVMASGAPSAAASQTGSTSPASPKSTGLAPARSLPTGVVIVAGGIFAAAIGL